MFQECVTFCIEELMNIGTYSALFWLSWYWCDVFNKWKFHSTGYTQGASLTYVFIPCFVELGMMCEAALHGVETVVTARLCACESPTVWTEHHPGEATCTCFCRPYLKQHKSTSMRTVQEVSKKKREKNINYIILRTFQIRALVNYRWNKQNKTKQTIMRSLRTHLLFVQLHFYISTAKQWILPLTTEI